MKKSAFVFMLLGTLLSSHAQTTFGIGPKVGIGLNTISEEINGMNTQQFYNDFFAGTEIEVRSFNVGFLAGGFAELMIANRIGFQVEFLLSGEGTGLRFRDKDSGESLNDGDDDITRRYRMTNIPMLAKIHLGGNFDIYGGIQLSSIREITELTGTRSDDNEPIELPKEDWSLQLEESWTSFVLGLSVEQEGFVIDARGTISPDIGKDPDVLSQTLLSAQLSIGYKLFGKRE
ncbi:MAG: outer membrane beta-barrel protein [Bacteroidota bacterium]